MSTAILALHWQVNVIEPQGFFGPMLATPVAESGVVERAAALHDFARDAGIPVIFTRFTVPEDEGELVRNTAFMQTVGEAQEAFRPEADGARIISVMADQPTAVYDNQRLSGLAGPATEWLAEHGIDTIYITGVATNLTVEQTARHGTDLGLIVHVVEDCVAAADPEVHAASLANLDLTTAGSVTAAEAAAQFSAP